MTDTSPPRTLDYVPIDDLPNDPRNAKGHDLPSVIASMRRWGYTDPVEVDERTGLVASGHGRKAALQQMRAEGMEPPEGIVVAAGGSWLAPVVRGWSSADDTEAGGYLVAANTTTMLGGWRPDPLEVLLRDVAASPGGLAGTGITDVDAFLAGLRQPEPGGPDPYDPAGADKGALSAAFGVPPFSVLSAREGWWRTRRAAWLALGIASEVTRGDIETQASHHIERGAASVSVFDPVLCEVAYRWFCPPGGRVLDPFAGGSVRGIVAAAAGLAYTGVDLRSEQVQANHDQWATISPALRVRSTPPDHTPERTPVEQHGDVWVKRDDAWSRGGATGAKSRTMFRLVEQSGAKGIITAGARNSPQIERAALTAAALGVRCRVHVPAGADTPETATCTAAGAEVVRHPAGRLSVLQARYRADVENHPGWLGVPFGMGMDEYVEDVAAEVEPLPEGVRRVVVPVGSGSTLAGVLRGLDGLGADVPVVGVRLGHDPTARLDAYVPGWRDRVQLVDAGVPFDVPAPEATYRGLRLDPYYEAKCVPHLQPGDLLWCVGIRASEAEAEAPATPPQWIVGDSAKVVPTLPGGYDLVFSCPPYADLERYSDDPADLSAMDYPGFLAAYEAIIAAAVARLAPNRFAVWVVGEVRGPDGTYRGLVPDTIRAFRDAGAAYYNEAILVTPLGSLPIRAGVSMRASRKLGRTHQQVLVFVKGDPRAAAAACGPVAFAEVPAETE